MYSMYQVIWPCEGFLVAPQQRNYRPNRATLFLAGNESPTGEPKRTDLKFLSYAVCIDFGGR